jgi:hypothetical protein
MNANSTSSSAPERTPDLWSAWMKWMEGLLVNNQMPLSGNVTQWIDVWGHAVGQVGMFNVNLGNSADPETEKEINRRYSYGRQLGRILDVLTPMVETQKSALAAKPGMQRKLDDFEAMVADIAAAKHGQRVTVAQMLEAVEGLRQDYPAEHEEEFKAALRSLARLQALPALG